jgi:uncharacterized protein
MNLTTQCQKLLISRGCSEAVIEHSNAVTEKALGLIDGFIIPLERDLVIKGAMLHDVGRSKSHGIEHNLWGAEIAKEDGFSAEVVRIIERHIGAGISLEEAVERGLPPKDYIPRTPEEITVSYADNLTNGSRHLTFSEALKRFESKLGPGHPAIERLRGQHQQIKSWTRKS